MTLLPEYSHTGRFPASSSDEMLQTAWDDIYYPEIVLDGKHSVHIPDFARELFNFAPTDVTFLPYTYKTGRSAVNALRPTKRYTRFRDGTITVTT